MAEKAGEAGVQTRSRRNRSTSREVSNGVAAPPAKATRSSQLEAVAEQATPSSQQSQKSVRTESSMSLGFNGGSSQGSRATSPTSFSRAQEKEELQNLNDRLAKILNKLNDSEEENRTLKIRLTTVQQETSADLNDQIGKYRDELERARKAVDAITQEKDRELLAKDKALGELNEHKAQFAALRKRLDELEARLKAAEKAARDKDNVLTELKAQLAESETAGKRIQKELADKTKQLDQARNQIEQEVISRTNLENALKTAEEKAKFENNLLESKLQRQSLSVTTVDHHSAHSTSRRSGSDFSASVEDMRSALEDAREEIQENMDRMYGSKLEGLEVLSESQKQTINGLNQALTASRHDMKDLQKENQQLRKKVGEVEKELHQQHQKFDQHKMDCTARIAALSDQSNQASQQYQALLEEYRTTTHNNVEMRTELEMYNKLLSDEEIRLGITSADQYGGVRHGAKKRKLTETFYTTPFGSRSSAGSRSAGHNSTPVTKSQVTRTTVKTSENKSKASGPVRILEVAPGKVVRLENISEAVMQLGHWRIHQHGASGDAAFQFEKDQVIGGQSIISVYSSTEDSQPNNGVTEIIATNAWLADSHLETVLSDGDGNQMATYEVSADSNLDIHNDSVRDSPRSAGKGILGFFGL
ncbi:putative Lamin-C [Hypsibius exemplaris]|nr:putative Lamin-C [Hypsibius exemplaris]